MSGPSFGSGLSTNRDLVAALDEACMGAVGPLQGRPPSLVALFATPEHWDDPALAARVRALTGAAAQVGSMTETVLAGTREVEHGPAIVVWAAHLPGATVRATHLTATDVLESNQVAALGALGRDTTPLVVLADPFTFPTGRLLELMNVAGRTAVGGLASGGNAPGEHRLLVGEDVVDDGAVVVAIEGVPVATVVSQGCAPFGPEMVVTDADGQRIHELAGQSALERLEEIVHELEPSEQALVAEGVLAGFVINENQPEYGRGDYLMRGILGGDRESGDLMIGDHVRVGQTLRFHVRDASTADADLRDTLRVARDTYSRPAGALAFCCNGRGRHMFTEPDHDAKVLQDELPGVTAAGMFCNGEIGPVGGRNFLHGFTATIMLFSTSQ